LLIFELCPLDVNDSVKFLIDPYSSAPEILLPWLTHASSLTEKLQHQAGEAKLEVLRQDWNRPNWWDRHALGLTSAAFVLHREILMHADRQVCWYARTIIPKQAYEANSEFFEKLGEKSLGVIIFNSPNVQRHELFYYPITPLTLEYHWLNSDYVEQCPQLWARLSSFSIDKNAVFFLVEILLPGLLRISM
jgi:chorismate--pyruvate lyase